MVLKAVFSLRQSLGQRARPDGSLLLGPIEEKKQQKGTGIGTGLGVPDSSNTGKSKHIGSGRLACLIRIQSWILSLNQAIPHTRDQ